MSKTETAKALFKLPTAWLGILLIVVAFAILIRQPIQASRWYWVEIWNYVTALLVNVPAALLIALSIAKIEHKKEQEVKTNERI